MLDLLHGRTCSTHALAAACPPACLPPTATQEDATPVPAAALPGFSLVWDAVYTPLHTRLLRWAVGHPAPALGPWLACSVEHALVCACPVPQLAVHCAGRRVRMTVCYPTLLPTTRRCSLPSLPRREAAAAGCKVVTGETMFVGQVRGCCSLCSRPRLRYAVGLFSCSPPAACRLCNPTNPSMGSPSSPAPQPQCHAWPTQPPTGR